MSLPIGSRVGTYRIVAPIGAGGMGEVFRARDDQLNRDVAIKILHADVAADTDRLQRFLREAQSLAALNHPNIAQIYGLEATPSALIMELVEGENLAQRLSRGAIPVDEAIAIAQQIAEALEAAHELGIVHRDIKPANVRLRADGVVKILDFGLAKAFAPAALDGAQARDAGALNKGAFEGPGNSPTITSPAVTQAGLILGTAAYMSPEQARGKAVDKRSDIWAFGVVFFEMLTGGRLFVGETVTDVMAAVVSKSPDWSALPGDVPPAVVRLLRRCLEKDHRRRLRDIGEARVTLSAPDSWSVDTAPVEHAPRAVRAWMPWTVAALAIVVAAGIALLPRTPPAPVRQLEIALPPDAAQVKLSPDGTAIAYRSASHIRVLSLDRPESRDLVAAARQGADVLAWSRDSAFIAYDFEGKLWKVAASGGPPQLLSTIPETGELVGLAWRRDDSLVIAVWRGSMYTVPATGGEATRLVALDSKTEIDFHDPIVLADDRVAFSTHRLPERGGPANLYQVEWVGGGRRERVLGNGVFLVGTRPSGEVLLERWDANGGLWAVPMPASGALDMNAGRLVVPAATDVSIAGPSLLLYAIDSDPPQSGELVWVDRAGPIVGQLGPSQIRLSWPVLSPDERQVVYSAGTGDHADIWIRDLQTGAQSRVTSDPVDDIEPTWFPNGRRLVYMERSGVGAERIVVRDSDGGGRMEIGNGRQPLISADGRQLLFLIDDRGTRRLWSAPIAADGTIGEPKPFFATAEQPIVTGFSVSPARDLLAYVEPHPGGRPEVYVTRFPSGQGRWQITTAGGRAPVWSNAELLFVGGPNVGQKQMMAVRIQRTPTFAVGTPFKLFDITDDLQMWSGGSAAFDVAADGKQFVMVRLRGATAQPTRRWILAENWARD